MIRLIFVISGILLLILNLGLGLLRRHPPAPWIAYTSLEAQATNQLWIVNPAQPEQRRRFDVPYQNFQAPVISPDGGQLALLTSLIPPNLQIVYTHPFGQRMQMVPVASASHAKWSPDGASLVFSVYDSINLFIQQYHLPSQTVTTILNKSNVDAQPAWSPDGESLIFASRSPELRGETEASNEGIPRGAEAVSRGLWDLYRYDLAADTITRLTTGEGSHQGAHVSPDGQRVVYHRTLADGSADMFIIHLDGSQHQNITQTPDQNEQWAQWSPDGQWLVFISFQTIEIMRPDGRDRQVIVRQPYADKPSWYPVADLRLSSVAMGMVGLGLLGLGLWRFIGKARVG